MEYNDDLDPEVIKPLHGVTNQDLLCELVTSMKEEDWGDHRRLLVIETKKGYLAWTGSHRIAAAREAGLPEVPCLIVPEEDLPPDLHSMDWERLKILQQTDLEDATNLMWLEERSGHL